MQFILPISMLLALVESYTFVNYFGRRECGKGNTAMCSNLPQQDCCSSGKTKFRSTKFTGITTGDVCIVWDAPGCAKVNEAKSNQRCVSQTQTATGAKFGGSSVSRQTGKKNKRGEDIPEECNTSHEVDQVNMDGYVSSTAGLQGLLPRCLT